MPVLAEAMSELNASLERDVLASIANVKGEYAIISITNHLSTVEDPDRISIVVSRSVTEGGPRPNLGRG